MTAIRSAITSLVAGAHNLWAQLPVALQAALMVLVLALWTFTQGYGWYIPSDPTNLQLWLAEFNNAAVLAWAVAFPIITQRVWPALIPWVLSLMQLQIKWQAQTRIASVMASQDEVYRPVTLWTKAA